MDTEKILQQLRENNMYDESTFLYCTKWNASMGAQIITTYKDDLFITPFEGGIYGVNIKKAQKYNKSEIESIEAVKSFWTGSRICIKLKENKKIKFKLVNNSWINSAEKLASWLK